MTDDNRRRTDEKEDPADRRRRRRRRRRHRGARRLRRDGARRRDEPRERRTSTRRSSATHPYFASQSPVLCSLLSFFDRHEALTVEAFTARLLPGDDGRPRRAGALRRALHRPQARAARDLRDADLLPAAVREAGQGPRARPRRRHDLRRREGSAAVRLPVLGHAAGRLPQGHRGARQGDAVALRQRLRRPARKAQDEVIAGMEATDPSAKPGDYPPAREGGQAPEAASSPRRRRAPSASSRCSRTTRTRASSPTRSTAATADFAGWKLDRLPGRAAGLDGGRAQARARTSGRSRASRDMPPMNPGHPQHHVILPLAGSTRKQS